VSFNLFEDHLGTDELVLLRAFARQQLGGYDPRLGTFNESHDMKVGLVFNLS
jgi:hypothetical protein